jgi:hypothetical protein
MSEAYRCDITGECIAAGGNKNPYWTILQNSNVTVLGVGGVAISIDVKVDVFKDGTQCHVGDTARAAINQMIKNYVQNNL